MDGAEEPSPSFPNDGNFGQLALASIGRMAEDFCFRRTGNTEFTTEGDIGQFGGVQLLELCLLNVVASQKQLGISSLQRSSGLHWRGRRNRS